MQSYIKDLRRRHVQIDQIRRESGRSGRIGVTYRKPRDMTIQRGRYRHRIRRRETPSRLRARAQGFEKAAVRTWKRLKKLEREIVAKQQKKLAKQRKQK